VKASIVVDNFGIGESSDEAHDGGSEINQLKVLTPSVKEAKVAFLLEELK